MTMRKRRGSMFGASKHPGLASVVSIESPAEARKSAATLKRKFKSYSRRDAKVRTKRAAVLAANRAGAMLKKKNLSAKERSEMRQVKKIYNEAAKGMKL